MKKFTSKVEYNVFKHQNIFTGKSHIAFRYLDLTITSDSMESAEIIWKDCINYIANNSATVVEVVGCPAKEIKGKGKYSYYDSIVVFDREEFEQFKELINEWKNNIKKKAA